MLQEILLNKRANISARIAFSENESGWHFLASWQFLLLKLHQLHQGRLGCVRLVLPQGD